MTSLSVSWGLKMSGPLMRIQARYNLYDLNINTRGDNLMKSNDFSKLKKKTIKQVLYDQLAVWSYMSLFDLKNIIAQFFCYTKF